MPKFKNPNDPMQPQAGVYVWSCLKNDTIKKTLYVGSAGIRKTLLPKGTLFRGVSQAQKGLVVSTDKHKKDLDVDFIIGTAISLFEQAGWTCYWEHVDNDPLMEKKICSNLKPILQDSRTANVLSKFKNRKTAGSWNTNYNDISQATKLISKQLKSEIDP